MWFSYTLTVTHSAQAASHLRLAYAFGLPSGPSTGAVRRGCWPCSSRARLSNSERAEGLQSDSHQVELWKHLC